MFNFAKIFRGLRPLPPTGALPLDPAGGLGGPQTPRHIAPYGVASRHLRSHLRCD